MNKACLNCHAEIADDIPGHTHHKPDSSGSDCNNCHMPHTVYGLLSAIRSHIECSRRQPNMETRNRGFTLMEVIGVMAVIAIIAAVATPQIFQAIEDAKVTTLIQESNDLKANVARYYKDTGLWPRHIPSSSTDGQQQLMVVILSFMLLMLPRCPQSITRSFCGATIPCLPTGLQNKA